MPPQVFYSLVLATARNAAMGGPADRGHGDREGGSRPALPGPDAMRAGLRPARPAAARPNRSVMDGTFDAYIYVSDVDRLQTELRAAQGCHFGLDGLRQKRPRAPLRKPRSAGAQKFLVGKVGRR